MRNAPCARSPAVRPCLMEGSDSIELQHPSEAISYRSLIRNIA
jgi:hypothetical protein